MTQWGVEKVLWNCYGLYHCSNLFIQSYKYLHQHFYLEVSDKAECR